MVALRTRLRGADRFADLDNDPPETTDDLFSVVEPEPEPEPEAVGPQTPLSGFDLLEGRGRLLLATRRLNRWTAAVAVLVVATTVAYSMSVRANHAQQTEALAASNSNIEQLNSSIQAASHSVLPQATLEAHLSSRSELAYGAYELQTPYDRMFRDAFTVAAETGVTIRSVDFRDQGGEGVLTFSADAPSLPALGQFTTLLENRFGVEQDLGYIESLVPTYRSNPDTDELQFTAELTVTLQGLRSALACDRLASIVALADLPNCSTAGVAEDDDPADLPDPAADDLEVGL